MSPVEKSRDAINTLSESSPVRLGLAVALIIGVIALYTKSDNTVEKIREDMRENYVSRDLFKAEMDAMRRENQMRADTLSAQISELRVAVAAAQASAVTSK